MYNLGNKQSRGMCYVCLVDGNEIQSSPSLLAKEVNKW